MKIKSPLVVGTAVNRSLATSCSPPPAIACLHLWSLASTFGRSPPPAIARVIRLPPPAVAHLPFPPSTCHRSPASPPPAIASLYLQLLATTRSPSSAIARLRSPPTAISGLHWNLPSPPCTSDRSPVPARYKSPSYRLPAMNESYWAPASYLLPASTDHPASGIRVRAAAPGPSESTAARD